MLTQPLCGSACRPPAGPSPPAGGPSPTAVGPSPPAGGPPPPAGLSPWTPAARILDVCWTDLRG